MRRNLAALQGEARRACSRHLLATSAPALLLLFACETPNGTARDGPQNLVRADPEAFEINPVCLEDPGKHAWIDVEADRNFVRADSAFRIGNELFDSGDHRAAAEAFTRAVSTDPMHGLAHLALAKTHLYTDNDHSAMQKHLAAAVLLLPNNPRAHVRYAELSAELGASALAIRHWQCALELKPTLPDAHYALARSHLADGAHALAEKSVRSAIANDGERSQYYVFLGQVFEAKGALLDAARAVETAAKMVERSAALYRRAGALYQAGGDESEAARIRAIADEIDPPAEGRKLRPLRKARKKRRRSRRKR